MCGWNEEKETYIGKRITNTVSIRSKYQQGWIPLVTNIANSIWPNSWSYYFLIQKPYYSLKQMHNLPNLEQCYYLMKYTFRQKKNAINVLALTAYVKIYLTWFILHIIYASCFVLDLPCWKFWNLQCKNREEELEKKEWCKNFPTICMVLPWPCHNIAWL